MNAHRELPTISGKKLIKLAVRDGWIVRRRTKHGVGLAKSYSDRTRVTVVQDTGAILPDGTLSKILGHKQMGIGKKGLRDLIDKYGI